VRWNGGGNGSGNGLQLTVVKLSLPIAVPADCPQERVIERTWTATDDCGNRSECVQVITVVDITPPRIYKPADDATVECDGAGNLAQLQAWLESQGGAVADDDCGKVTWTYSLAAFSDDCGLTGSALATFTATDECGNSDTTAATFTIKDSTPPTIDGDATVIEMVDCFAAPPEDENGSGATGSGSGGSGCPDPLPVTLPAPLEPTVSDACSEPVGIERLEDIEVPGCPGSIVRTWVATDSCDNSSQVEQIILIKKVCVQKANYWKKNPDAWLDPFGPVAQLNLGCLGTLTAAEAMEWLDSSAHGDASVELAQELIVATLNVLQGADDPVAANLIEMAQNALCAAGGIGSDPADKDVKKLMKDLEKSLKDYNAGKLCVPKCGSGKSGSGQKG